MEVVVTGAKRYSFINKETGEKVEGMTIFYLPEAENESNTIGSVPVKMSTKLENWSQMSNGVPALYNLDLGFSPDSRGNVKVKLVGLNYVKPVKIQA